MRMMMMSSTNNTTDYAGKGSGMVILLAPSPTPSNRNKEVDKKNILTLCTVCEIFHTRKFQN